MPRYTDIDKLLEIFDADEPTNWTDTEAEIQEQRDFEYYRGIVENATTADVEEVVRCRDCVHWSPLASYGMNSHRTDGYCNMLSQIHYAERDKTEQDHFCSYGERKEK